MDYSFRGDILFLTWQQIVLGGRKIVFSSTRRGAQM